MSKWIKNFDELAVSEGRQKALQIIEAGLSASDTEKIIKNKVSLSDHTLTVKDEKIPLDSFKRLRVIGFGKASSKAALALEEVLGSLINDGLVIDIKKENSEIVETFEGTHPKPSRTNVEISKNIAKLASEVNEDDLVFVIVSGGGSALLCWPEREHEQGEKLYEDFLKTGGSIRELNTIRKHISLLKGGGLAKLLYPATVVGLIFCDVPGNFYEDVASGPTYKDESTIKNAEKIIKKYNLDEYDLMETPKEDKFFEKVTNIPMVSNKTSLSAMRKKAQEMGLRVKIYSDSLYGSAEDVAESIFKEEGGVVLAGGEVAVEVKKNLKGSGGRNAHLALSALKEIKEDQIFISLASDGIDNSEVAGAIVDRKTKIKAQKLNIVPQDYLDNYDAYNFLKQTDDLIITGPTGINVADLMLLLRGDEN